MQVVTSGRTKSPVDIITKVAFQYKLFILKRNFCFHANRRFGPTCCVTLYTNSIVDPIEPRGFVVFSIMTCDCPLVWLGLAFESATLTFFSEKPGGSTGWDTGYKLEW